MEEPFNSDDLVDIGEDHHKAGRLSKAEACYRKALKVDPGHPGALYYLANIAYEDGRLALAIELANKLLEEEPNDVEAWHLLGMIAYKEEDFSRAIGHLDRALAIQPNYVQAHCSKGSTVAKLGDYDAAARCYQSALSLSPTFGEALFGMGCIFSLQNQLDRAVSYFRQAIASNYSSPPVHIHLANALLSAGNVVEAKETFERAISLDPNCADVYRNYAYLLVRTGKINEGLHALKRAVSLRPGDSELRSALALALHNTGRLREAVACLEEAIIANPNNVEVHSILLGFRQYLPGYSRESIFADHLAFGDVFEYPPLNFQRRHPKPTDARRRLRVGFVSADLYSHPVGYFMEGVLRELYRRNESDIVIYAMNKVSDSLTDRLRATAHLWLPATALSDDVFERRIHNDNIDILIDLSGHTVPNRLPVFARKPAPVQVTWLGYWETTGLRAMDYIFCDRYGVRGGDEKYFVEQPWYLPHTRLCFTLPDEAVAVAPLPALKNGFITFGCFNNLVKMTDDVVQVWAQVLKRVTNSRLLLKSISFADSGIRESVTERFAAEGISADRLDMEMSSPRHDYFAAYNRVDIALDPFPFPGGTTSVEGIWMGVPMVTLRGDRIVSRQGESILQNVDLPDWIAKGEDDYVELATKKASDVLSLAQLRSGLRNRLEMSPLCDARLFAQNLEEAFAQMWLKYCEVSPDESTI